MKSIKLKEAGAVRYSKGERKIFATLPPLGAKRSSADITQLYYYGSKTAPFNARKIVIGLLGSLSKKVTVNKEPFRIIHSKRSGPIAMLFWLERRR